MYVHLLTDTDTGTRPACEGEGPMSSRPDDVTCAACRVTLDAVHYLDDDADGWGPNLAPVDCGATVWRTASVFAGDVTCADCLTADPTVVHYAADGENVYAHGPTGVYATDPTCRYVRRTDVTSDTAHVHTACGLDASGADHELRMSDHPLEVTCRTCVAGGLPDVHAVGDGDETLCGEDADDYPTDGDDGNVTCPDCLALIARDTTVHLRDDGLPVPVCGDDRPGGLTDDPHAVTCEMCRDTVSFEEAMAGLRRKASAGRHRRGELAAVHRDYLRSCVEVADPLAEHAGELYGLTASDVDEILANLT